MNHLNEEQLEAGLDLIRQSPQDNGTLDLVVCRATVDQRTVLPEARLDPEFGLQGDSWLLRSLSDESASTPRPETQLTIMNSRAIALMAQKKDRWPLAGDQLYMDLELSESNLPLGTRISLGSAVIEVTEEAHNGCKKFTERFGLEAMKFVNSAVGKQLHLRGIYAKVIQPGSIHCGDVVKKVE